MDGRWFSGLIAASAITAAALLLLIPVRQTALAAPDAPRLAWPEDGTILPDMTTTLGWAPPIPSSYIHVQVTPYNSDGPGIDVVLTGSQSSFKLPPPPEWC